MRPSLLGRGNVPVIQVIQVIQVVIHVVVIRVVIHVVIHEVVIHGVDEVDGVNVVQEEKKTKFRMSTTVDGNR